MRTPTLLDSTTTSNRDITSAICCSRSTWPAVVTKLFVRHAVFSFAEHRRTASTISGRRSPARASSTLRASMRWPAASASASKSWQNSSSDTSLRSSSAHAFVSRFVALRPRRNPRAAPASRSYRLNASNGLVRMTPPKSKSTASITLVSVTGSAQEVDREARATSRSRGEATLVDALVVAVEHRAVVLEGHVAAEEPEPVAVDAERGGRTARRWRRRSGTARACRRGRSACVTRPIASHSGVSIGDAVGRVVVERHELDRTRQVAERFVEHRPHLALTLPGSVRMSICEVDVSGMTLIFVPPWTIVGANVVCVHAWNWRAIAERELVARVRRGDRDRADRPTISSGQADALDEPPPDVVDLRLGLDTRRAAARPRPPSPARCRFVRLRAVSGGARDAQRAPEGALLPHDDRQLQPASGSGSGCRPTR